MSFQARRYGPGLGVLVVVGVALVDALLFTLRHRSRPAPGPGAPVVGARPAQPPADAAAPDAGAPVDAAPAAPSSASSVAPPDAGARAPGCAALLAENEAKLKRFMRRCALAQDVFAGHLGAGDPNVTSSAVCQEVPGGFVGFATEAIDVVDGDCKPARCSDGVCEPGEKGKPEIKLRKALVFETAVQRLVVRKQRLRQPADAGHPTRYELTGLSDDWGEADDHTELQLVAAFDYDGDGVPEVAIQRSSHLDCESSSSLGIWKIAGATLIPYPLQPRLELVAIRDEDRDGRPDLVTHGAYDGLYDSCRVDREAAPAIFVHHSLPDGSFSATDEVARTALRSACPTRTADLPVWDREEPADDLTHALVCARLWGTPVDKLLRRLSGQCQSFVDDSDGCAADAGAKRLCPSWIKSLIEVRPGVKLP